MPHLNLPDIVMHYFLYLGFGLIFAFFLYNLKFDLSWMKNGITTFSFIAIYGLGDEIHQIFVAGRNFSLLDLLMNVIGGISGWLLFIFLYNYLKELRVILPSEPLVKSRDT
ncbi:VanZ family protein [Desulfobacterota bacterium AH_259_B03_O07]|nr:VanZ family protein [Desulfobacterota bacterium AH_259_B03_O07]